ncbi:ABC transporter ATP-binding protein [Microbacterium hominis]|uniref:ABC transporter ATP-binding protein n=1 Tax=Microbacterium hominis TaxID=162426 RepID=A0A7D4QEY9_9MICO|nr:ABC transporter ATP-binding protein [Microbacterium hominis]QKJ21277.1 ABC transporter ATP-binding protein [Microbacterium hominis]
MIEIAGLSKSYGDKRAVDDISFTARAGSVTGFLGPNGAGKSTTMRMIMGLDRPDAGTARIDGKPLREHAAPMRVAGALLEAKSVAPGRTARNHLRVLAATHGISDQRVDEVIHLTGLDTVADKRAKGFSLGMGQRLGIATAMLGDPSTLIMDEPVNGLDPDGVLWVRNLARHFAAEGRTVLLSSHLMSEVELTADRVVVIGRGRILADTSVAAFTAEAASGAVTVKTNDNERLTQLIAAEGGSATPAGDTLTVEGIPGPRIAQLAVGAGLDLHTLVSSAATLEEAYLRLTADAVEYHATDASAAQEGAAA